MYMLIIVLCVHAYNIYMHAPFLACHKCCELATLDIPSKLYKGVSLTSNGLYIYVIILIVGINYQELQPGMYKKNVTFT